MDPRTEYSTQELLRDLTEGSTDAFTQLYDRYHAKIMYTAFLLVRQKELAEDIVQDVFMKCWVKRAELLKVDDFEGWLFVVARNHAINMLKRIISAEGKIENLRSGLPGSVNDTDSRANVHIYETQLQAALSLLTEQQRKAFELSHFEGMNRSEIAELMHLSPNTVKMHLVRALRIIRTQLAVKMELLVLFILLKKIF